MAIYGRHREQWDPTKIKSKTSKNKTYNLEVTNQSIAGNSVTANPDSNTGTESAQDTTNWHWVSSASGTAGNDSGEDPKQPSSGIPINGGGTYGNEIYPMGGGSGATRLLAYKQAITGSRTVTFKILACGGGGGGVAANVFNPNGTNAGNAMGGTSTKEWIGGGSDPYRPIQLVYATDGFGHDANWQKVPGSSDIHGHHSSHPNASTNNLTNGSQGFGTEFKPFTVEVSGISGNYYLGVRQQTGGSQYNTWAIADLVVTEAPRNIRRHKLTDTMLYRFFMNNEGDAKITAAERETRVSTDAFYLQGYRDQAITKYPSGWNPPLIDIDVSRFGKAINFGASANDSATNQNQYNMIAQQAPTEWTLDQLFGDSGTYSEPGARQIYFSFWFRRDTQNAVNDGHTFAMLAYEGNSGMSQPKSTDPRISFYCNSTGQMHMRFTDETSDGTGNPGDKYVTIDGTPAFLQCGSDGLRVGIGTWHHVTFAVKLTSGWDVDEIVDNTMIFIDGVRDVNPQVPVKRNKTAFTVGLASDAIWEWNFGSLINCYGAYDSSDHTLRRSSGFKGALGEFTVITNSGASDSQRIEFAKVLFEASKEGSHALHSGAHSSSPRLEQIDLDRDSAYPSNFTMNSYTKFSDSLQYASGRDSRVGLQPSDAFQEGYNTGESWKEKAGKYHIQSTVSSGTESVTVMPHLRLNPADTILTNGNWYSDARSEFFSEDLNATSGFVVSNTNDSASTKHVPIVSDELYREHVSTDLPAFVESDMGEEFKDCFVIEIPLPHTGGSLKLSTDAEDTTGGVSNEIAMRRFNSGGGGSGSTVDPVQKINTMAYYNFKDKKWEYTVPSYTTYAPDGQAGGLPWVGTGDIGFSPMSGLVFPKQGRNLEYFASLYGKPMTDCGFPFHKKFESEVGQTIDLSKYLDESVILEGWEIHCDVIPRVGYSHNISNGAAANSDEDGYHEVYGSDFNNSSTSKSPLYYGATGEAAVLWDPDGGETIPFYQKGFGSGTAQFRFDNTIPVSSFASTYVTGSDGTVTETKTETKPTKSSKGLVTKGVTAFLLKETDLFDKKRQREKWLRAQARFTSGNANDRGSGESSGNYAYTRSNNYAGLFYPVHRISDTSINATAGSSNDGLVYPPNSFEFYEPQTTRYSRGSSRELIGYLQQLYHNDPSGSLDRSFWVREDSGNTAGGIAPNWRTQESIVKLLDKENDVYVSNLLRQNSDIYPLSVSGSCKIQTPYAGSFPISNFKIAGSSGTNLGVYKHSLTTPGGIDLYHSYGVIPSSEGSTFSEFVQHDTVPNIQGKDKSISLNLPESLYPAGQVTDNAKDWQTKVLSPFDVSIPQEEDCDVVLRPTDKLILGIQDSISTTFASQQIQHNASGAQFVRWGRNYLEVPNSQSGYLRLFVRRTRNDKTYNVIADESTYSANVTRDLGDHLIDDDYVVNPPLMYSGSMADDIIGPTTFTPPLMLINISVDSSVADTQAAYHSNWTFNRGGAAFWNISRNLSPTSMVTSTNYNLSAGAYHVPLNWGSCSRQVFKDRSQPGTTVRRPAITWHDPSGFNKADYDGVHWYNTTEALHWVISKRRDNTAIEPNEFPWDNDSSASGSDARIPFRNTPVCVIEELNPRYDSTTTGLVVTTISGLTGSDTVKNGTIDKTIAGVDSPGHSAWNLQVFLPVFQKASATIMTPIVNGVMVDFRLVKIDSRPSNFPDWTYSAAARRASGQRPQAKKRNGSTVDLRVGDCFYFNASNEAIIIDLDKSTVVSNPGSADRWIRHGVGSGTPVVTIFIVMGEIIFTTTNKEEPTQFGYNTQDGTGSTLVKPLSYKSVYGIISRVLDIQCTINEELLAKVINPWQGTWQADINGATTPQIPRVQTSNTTFVEAYGPKPPGITWRPGPQVTGFDGSFSLELPQDPVLRDIMTQYQSTVNEIIDFKLCGKSLVGINPSDVGDHLDDNLWFWDGDGAIVAVPDHDFGDSTLKNTHGGMLGNVTQEDSYWFGDYLKPWVSTSTALAGNPSQNGLGLFASTQSGYSGQFQPNSMYKIDYTGIITTAPKLSITNETYNDTINRRIDRFVQRRTTELENVSDATKPLMAGPFGSLKNYIGMSSSNLIFDSIPASSLANVESGYCTVGAHSDKAACEAASGEWVDTNYFTLAKDIPQSFPFESSDERSFDVGPDLVKIRMKTSTSGGRTGDNTTTVEYTEATGDAVVGIYSWGFTTYTTNPYSEGALGYLNVTNYVHDEFKGNSDFSKKTVRDLLIGFGNGVQGRHVIRPDLYEYKAFTGSDPVQWSSQYIIDKPRGSRFGQYNIEKLGGAYKFNYHRFGHLRDMLEQAIDTKFINHAQDERVFGSPVVVSPVNPINPEVPKLMENTSRYNKTAHATVKKPFIESNYEATPQPVNLNSETLRVDVAGSIRTRGVTAPGNIAANIRSRG